MTPRTGSVPKAIALVPLAALSVAWTVQVVRAPEAGVSVVSGPAGSAPAAPTRTPTAPAVPDTALVVPPGTDAPASVWGDTEAPTAPAPAAVPAAAVPTSIPSVALAAYQRAATVMSTADPTCHLDWTLLAGIGRVESDHGSHGGSGLSEDGHATPAIVGPALTGLGGTLLVADTDGGLLDGDNRFDHAVGPMQFVPGTWSVVGVDGDGDGQRDPQDIDDAALAAGVYLCSGPEDLATPAGQQAALLRYNHSASYVATVLRFTADYATGMGATAGYVAARPLGVVPAVALGPADEAGGVGGDSHKASGKKRHKHHHAAAGTGAAPAGGAAGAGGAGHHGPPTQAPASSDSTPTAPVLEPLPTATDDQLESLCTAERVLATYSKASQAAVVQATQACIVALRGQTWPEAQDHIAEVVGGLRDQGIEGLEPVEQPTEDPSADPTGSPSSQPTGAPADSSSGAPGTAQSPSGDAPGATASADASSAP